jgi:hypothetical protein
MVLVRVLTGIGALVMAATIAWGFATASFTEEGAALLDLAWGRVTLIDIYLAFLLVWGWIAWRERSAVRAMVWLAATIVLGSLALFGYAFLASLRAGTPVAFLVGPHRHADGGADLPEPPARRGGAATRS